MSLVQSSELSRQPLSPHRLPGLIPHWLRLAVTLKDGHALVSTIQTAAKLLSTPEAPVLEPRQVQWTAAGFNPPFTLPWWKTNEVMTAVVRRKASRL